MLSILTVEDDAHDAFLFRMAVDREGIKNPIRAVKNGNEAVAYLHGHGKFSDRDNFPFPDIIVTDLKMPVMDGFEMLKWLRAHSAFFVIPIIVFSGSNVEDDVEKAYRFGANAYMVKPASLRELQKIIRTVHDFWTNCERPRGNTAV